MASMGMLRDELEEALAAPSYNHWQPYTNGDPFVYVLPRYQPSRYTLITNEHAKKLERMTPEQFGSSILRLPTEQLQSLMVDQKFREMSFSVLWPHLNRSALSAERMADAGFYYTGSLDIVKCPYCSIELSNWNVNDDPRRRHAEASPCEFIQGIALNLSAEPVAEREIQNMVTVLFGDLQKRMDSYRNDLLPDDCLKLAEAGFYRIDMDKYACFYCAGELQNWTYLELENPWVEHARYFPDCGFLLEKKSQAFVDNVQTTTPDSVRYKNHHNIPQAYAYLYTQSKTRKKVFHFDEAKHMYEICLKLGHRHRSIDMAIQQNGGPYQTVGELIEGLHVLEVSASNNDSDNDSDREDSDRDSDRVSVGDSVAISDIYSRIRHLSLSDNNFRSSPSSDSPVAEGPGCLTCYERNRGYRQDSPSKCCTLGPCPYKQYGTALPRSLQIDTSSN